jgi:hypothetical protein
MQIWKDYQPICRLCEQLITSDNYCIIGEEDTTKEIVNMYIHKQCPLGEKDGKENNNNHRGRTE